MKLNFQQSNREIQYNTCSDTSSNWQSPNLLSTEHPGSLTLRNPTVQSMSHRRLGCSWGKVSPRRWLLNRCIHVAMHLQIDNHPICPQLNTLRASCSSAQVPAQEVISPSWDWWSAIIKERDFSQPSFLNVKDYWTLEHPSSWVGQQHFWCMLGNFLTKSGAVDLVLVLAFKCHFWFGPPPALNLDLNLTPPHNKVASLGLHYFWKFW